MPLCRITFLLLMALLLPGWPTGVSSAVAQEKADPESKEGELAASEKLGKLTLTLDPGWHTGFIRKIFFTPDGERVTSIAEDHAIRIWDPATGEMHKVLYPPGHGGLSAADLSADGKRLAVASRYFDGDKLSHAICVVALPEGRIERVLKGNALEITSVAISRDGKLVAFRGRTDTRIWNVDKEEPAKVVRKSGQLGLAFSPDGARLACSGLNGGIIDLATGKELAKLKGTKSVAWSPDGKTLATIASTQANGTGLHLMNADGKEIRILPRKAVGNATLAFSADSRTLLATSEVFDVATGESKARCVAPGGVAAALSPDGRFAVTAGPKTAVWKTENGAVHKQLTAPKWIRVVGREAAWSPDGMAVSWDKSPKEPSFHVGDLRFGPALTEARGPILKQGPWTIDAALNSFRVLKDGKQTCVVKMGGHSTLFGKDQVVAGSRTNLVLIDAHSGKVLRQFDTGQSWVSDIAPSPDGRFFLTISNDASQRLRIWNPQQEKPLLSMYRRGADWILWTPEGYYAATPGGERIMGWVVDNGIDKMAVYYPAERFRKQMYRPDVIKLLLVKGNLKDALTTANAALNQAGTKVADGVADLNKQLPPQAALQILDTKDLPRVKVKASAVAAVKEQPVTALRLLVDGRPLSAEASVKYATAQPKAEVEWTITLPPGKHQLAVLARSADSSSRSNTVEIAVADPSKQNALHVLAIGVSDYEERTLKLDFAAKDAQDIAANFAKCCKGELFADVVGETLVNAKARKEVILKHLADLRKKAKPSDLAVIYFAGHGVKEKDKFYLLTVEANPAELAKTAISGEELRKALGEFPCQVLLMLDACHSSGSLKNFRPAVDDLTRNLTDDECGVAVLCAAMAHEKALEKGGNGLFTRAVVQALNRADGVPYNRHNRLFYVHHLHTFVFDEVSQQSSDRQHPFLSLPWVVESFPVSQFAVKLVGK